MILGTSLKAASREALLWLYLVSEKEQNFVDAIELVRSRPNLDLSQISPDAKARAKLEKVLSSAREPASSYEVSRARRP